MIYKKLLFNVDVRGSVWQCLAAGGVASVVSNLQPNCHPLLRPKSYE